MKAVITINHTRICIDLDKAIELFKALSNSEECVGINFDYVNSTRIEYFEHVPITLEVMNEERYAMAKIATASRIEKD